jgi:hypothetical protein
MKSPFAFAALALSLGGIVAASTFFLHHDNKGAKPAQMGWAEMPWPFPMDQWGRGKAYRCSRVACGAEVTLYFRAKLGFCDCTAGVATDDDLDRMSDFELVGNDVAPLDAGRPITVGPMRGRSRAYALLNQSTSGKAAISVAFNDRCDMVVATAVFVHPQPARIEPSILEFLNTRTVLQWVEVALGL